MDVESGSFYVGADGVLQLDSRFIRAVPPRKRPGRAAWSVGSLPDLQELPESPPASFCLPVTQVLRSGWRKGACLRGPGGATLAQAWSEHGQAGGQGGWKAVAAFSLPKVTLTVTALKKNPKHPSGVQRMGGPMLLSGRERSVGLYDQAQDAARHCSRFL